MEKKKSAIEAEYKCKSYIPSLYFDSSFPPPIYL